VWLEVLGQLKNSAVQVVKNALEQQNFLYICDLYVT
jgi:hypothetical protein